MRIKEIKIIGLFGMFDHTIPLNEDERITIIYSTNGYGKTTILRMINAVFCEYIFEFMQIPFAEFIIEFDDKSFLKITQNPPDKIIFFYKKIKEQEKQYCFNSNKVGIKNLPFQFKHFVYLSEKRWLDEKNNTIINSDISKMPKYLKERPKWLEELIKSISVNFIETQRLNTINRKGITSWEPFKYDTSISHIEFLSELYVNNYSERLIEKIESKLTMYAELSQKLDSSFPKRLLNLEKEKIRKVSEIRAELKKLEKKRRELKAVGILPKDDIDEDLSVNPNDDSIKILSLYIKDTNDKLNIFYEDNFYNKINLLLEIINKKFDGKEMKISRAEGFIFENEKGIKIPPDKLSSGEQHELVLNYELLFKTKPNSLILIDEPEISLHINWQEEFLKDLIEISKLNPIDILIATHSPSIISNRMDDLAIELTKTEEKVS